MLLGYKQAGRKGHSEFDDTVTFEDMLFMNADGESGELALA